MNKNLLLLFLCLLLSIQTKLLAQTDTIYVNINATGNNTGTSWTDAYKYFGDALKSSKYGDEIWVAKGIYTAKEANPFEIDKSLKLYGGFKGDELSLEQRDWKTNETILGRDKSILNTFRSNILYITNTDSTAVLDGFKVQDGYAYLYVSDIMGEDSVDCNTNPYSIRACHGGGIFMRSEDIDHPVFLNVYNCSFKNNMATEGGAISVESYNGIGGININNCEFNNNSADANGGAIIINLGSLGIFQTTIRDCIFNNNLAGVNSGALEYSSDNEKSKLLVENTNFTNNKCLMFFGGAMTSSNKNINGTIIRNCIFDNNYASGYKAGWGGALIGVSVHFINCKFSRNKAVQGGAIWGRHHKFLNCIFSDNYAGKEGGVMYLDGTNVDTTSFINCTMYNNSAGQTGGVVHHANTQYLNINNSIFSKNKALISGNNIYLNKNPKVNLSNTIADAPNIDSLCTSSAGTTIILGKTKIILDSVQFWDAPNGDFRISNCSKAIDAGDAKWTLAYGLNYDYNNGPRIKDKNPDLGAYEMDKFLSFDTLITNASTTQSLDGSITLLNIKGFKPPLNYTWSTGSKDPSIDMLQAGTYGVFIEDSLHCSEAFYFKVEALTSVNNISSLSEISIIPNTVNRFGTIPILSINSNIDQELTFQITNNSGIVIKKEQLSLLSGVNTKALPNTAPGIYYVVLENKEHQKTVLKYIVN